MRPSASTILTSIWGWMRPTVAGALETHGAGLGHAISDSHFAHMHARHHVAHHFDRARRARHNAGAQAGQIETGELGMAENGDEHGGDAVQACAALGLDGLQHGERVEPFGWADHASAMGDAGEVPQHHAEAMVERHGNAQPVSRRQPHRLADEKAVVEDVVVGQRRALGRPRRAAGELDVDRIVELQARLQRRQFGALGLRGRPGDVGEVEGARGPFCAQADHDLQLRQPRRLKFTWRGVVEFGSEGAQRADVIVAFEAGAEDQRLAADLVEHMVELVDAIGRIDVDEDQARLGRGELGQHPFRVVWRPDADPLAGPQAERHQAGGKIGHAAGEFLVIPTDILMPHDQRRAVGRSLGDAPEQSPDRLADERPIAGAVNVTLRHPSLLPAPSRGASRKNLGNFGAGVQRSDAPYLAITSSLTWASPALRKPRTSAARVERSMIRARDIGPRSTTTTVTSRPLLRLVTCRRVPNGSVRWAAIRPPGYRGWV
jgi:hypothetical protein